jgi:hypothetical protein
MIKPGDILHLKDEIKTQEDGMTITYGLDKGYAIPVIVLPEAAKRSFAVEAAINTLRKALS